MGIGQDWSTSQEKVNIEAETTEETEFDV